MKTHFSMNISPKEPNISPSTKFNKLLKCLESVRIKHYAFSALSRLLMRKNANNDVCKDCPIKKTIKIASSDAVIGFLLFFPLGIYAGFEIIEYRSNLSLISDILTDIFHEISDYLYLRPFYNFTWTKSPKSAE